MALAERIARASLNHLSALTLGCESREKKNKSFSYYSTIFLEKRFPTATSARQFSTCRHRRRPISSRLSVSIAARSHNGKETLLVFLYRKLTYRPLSLSLFYGWSFLIICAAMGARRDGGGGSGGGERKETAGSWEPKKCEKYKYKYKERGIKEKRPITQKTRVQSADRDCSLSLSPSFYLWFPLSLFSISETETKWLYTCVYQQAKFHPVLSPDNNKTLRE